VGDDDGRCEEATNGQHAFVLSELVPDKRGGMAKLNECAWCGVQAYEASAVDDPRRPPL
jgi:hypothetical protein